jgi:hypothetical protein
VDRHLAAQARPRGRPPLRRWLSNLLAELSAGETSAAAGACGELSHRDLDYLLLHLATPRQQQVGTL